jgi:predicted glycosyltransferase
VNESPIIHVHKDRGERPAFIVVLPLEGEPMGLAPVGRELERLFDYLKHADPAVLKAYCELCGAIADAQERLVPSHVGIDQVDGPAGPAFIVILPLESEPMVLAPVGRELERLLDHLEHTQPAVLKAYNELRDAIADAEERRSPAT